MHRTATIIVALLATLPFASAARVGDPCDAAILSVKDNLLRTGGQLDASTIQALGDATSSCEPAQTDTAPAGSPVGTKATLELRQGAPAQDCRLSVGTHQSLGEASIAGYFQIGTEAIPVSDNGPAVGSYLTGGIEEYEGTGQTYAFSAFSDGTGTMSAGRVPFPVTGAWAEVGCPAGGFADSYLCWGRGYSESVLVGSLQVLVFQLAGSAYKC